VVPGLPDEAMKRAVADQARTPRPAEAKGAEMAARKILVVFYSRSGTTRMVAKALAADLKCDAEEIVATKNRAGFVGIMRSLIEAMRQRPAQIAATRFNPSSYDLVVIGTPVWAWSVSSPIRAYLIDNNKNFPQVAFFCTLQHRGDETTFAQMQDLAGKVPRTKVAFRTHDVIAGRLRSGLVEFIRALTS
jgi:menaquinone-dependent protoporphyrinogen IX oxidase